MYTGWGYVDLVMVKFGYNVVNGICTKAASDIEYIHLKLVVATQVTFLLIWKLASLNW